MGKALGRLAVATAAAVSASVGATAGPPDPQHRCRTPANLTRFSAPLIQLIDDFKSGTPLRIVALGSSSTKGIGASNPKASYPVRLEAELRQRFPGRTITVANLGVPGQLAADMVKRIKRDVLPRKASLVVWQTGVNDAVRQVDLEAFRNTVREGITLLQSAGTDVVLLDMQYFPGAKRIRNYARYLAVMREVAERSGVPVLQRYAIMKHLITSAQYTPQQLLAADLFHPNDLTYDCVGTLLADAIADEVEGQERPRHLPLQAKQAGELPNVPAH